MLRNKLYTVAAIIALAGLLFTPIIGRAMPYPGDGGGGGSCSNYSESLEWEATYGMTMYTVTFTASYSSSCAVTFTNVQSQYHGNMEIIDGFSEKISQISLTYSSGVAGQIVAQTAISSCMFWGAVCASDGTGTLTISFTGTSGSYNAVGSGLYAPGSGQVVQILLS